MDVDAIREYCLSFPGATEDLQWGECLLFRVAKKIFVNVILAEVPPRIWVKCTPERHTEVLEIEGISRAPYLGRYHWVELESADVVDASELRRLIAESYENVRSRLPRRQREALVSGKPPAMAKRRRAHAR